jgi:hypothetical protein
MTALPSPPQRLFWLVNRNLDFLQIRDASGIVKGVSAAIEPLAGYDSVEPVAHHYQNIVHAEDRTCAEESFTGAMQRTRPGPVTLRYRAIGGSWRTS